MKQVLCPGGGGAKRISAPHRCMGEHTSGGGPLNRRLSAVLAAGLVVVFATGLLFVSSALGQQPPPQQSPDRRKGEPQCTSVLPRQAVDAILANHREPLRAAAEAMRTQERALHTLLVADNTTRAALDAEIARSNDARNAFARARMNALWDLRSVIPAQDRQVAFRCAQRLLFRGNQNR